MAAVQDQGREHHRRFYHGPRGIEKAGSVAPVRDKTAETYLDERRITPGEGACLLHGSAEAPPIRHCIRLRSILTAERGRRDHSDQNQRTKIGDEVELTEREEPGQNQIRLWRPRSWMRFGHTSSAYSTRCRASASPRCQLVRGTVEVWRQLEARFQEQHATRPAASKSRQTSSARRPAWNWGRHRRSPSE